MAQKKKTKQKSSKWLYGLLFFVLFVAVGLACYFILGAFFEIKNNNSESEEVDTVEIEEESVEQSEHKDNAEEDDDKHGVEQYDGEDPNQLEELTGSVTYAVVTDGVLKIRINIDQYLGGGRCNMSLIRDGVNIYNMSANISALVSTSTCDGFDVPVPSIGNGDYDIVVNLEAEGKIGVINGAFGI